ncbi:hypothetical protein [Vulcanisaeta souniana]|nr:hypothetical protein [Vulcanisaeta souniana]BDR91274.1 hypothetical protein Vsou_03670 [Vulcanisaeta souniana JCM 11219]
MLNELINRHRDIIIRVLRLGIDCCGDDCISRVTDWTRIKELNCRMYGLMIDPDQVHELLRRPSLIRSLLRMGINRLIIYPCATLDLVTLLGRLGFTVMNYITSDECPLTQEVVIHLDAYRIINLVRRGIVVYAHLYNPYIRERRDHMPDAYSVLNGNLEYLMKMGTRLYLILDVNDH